MTMRIRTIAVPAVAAFVCSALVGCADRSVPHLPTQNGASSKDPKRMSMGELQQYASTSAVLAVAETGTSLTQSSAPPPPIGRINQPASNPFVAQPAGDKPAEPQMPVMIQPAMAPTQMANASKPASKEQLINAEVNRSREGFKIEAIRSGFFANQQDAQRDALNNASQQVLEKLRQLDHPIYLSKLLPYEVAKYVVPNSGRVVPLSKEEEAIIENSKVPTHKICYQLDLELDDRQVRQLRGEERIRFVLPFVIGVVCLSGVAGLFLRLTGMAATAVRRTVG